MKFDPEALISIFRGLKGSGGHRSPGIPESALGWTRVRGTSLALGTSSLRSIKASFDGTVSFFGHVTEKLAGVRVAPPPSSASDPHAAAATQAMARLLYSQFLIEYVIVTGLLYAAALALLAFVVLPLLYKAIVRRRLRVFISFHHSQEQTALLLAQRLEQARFRPHRIEYREGADHQEILSDVTGALTKCHVVVCIPGRAESFVDHEVLAATTLGKSVTFLISEDSGTLPNTADKRYPAFRLEVLEQARFEPLISFLRYIGADYSSTKQICKRALAHALVASFWSRMCVALLIGVTCFWGYCYIRVSIAAARALPQQPEFPFADPIAVFWSNVLVLAAAGTIAITCALFVGLALTSQIRQLWARRRARLRAVKGLFRREDWIGTIPDLSPWSDVYQAMFETAPRAHHERPADAGSRQAA